MEDAGGMAGDIILGVSGVGGILWAVYERFIRHRVEKANSDSEVAVLTANETLFKMITSRMESLEAQVERLQKQLDNEREYTKTLITLMIGAGMTPPPYQQ